MWRNLVRRSLGVLLLASGPLVAVTIAGAEASDEPPPLSPPSLTPMPGSSPPAPAPTAARTDVPPPIPAFEPIPAGPTGNRPMLVIPGVNAPGRMRSRPRTASLPLPTLQPAGATIPDDAPGLVAPSDPTASPGASAARLASQPTSGPPTTSSPGTTPRPETTRSTSAPDASAKAPARRSTGFFGRWLPAPFGVSTSRKGEDRPSVTAEPSTDPAAGAAVKRRVERQINDLLGDRVRDVEVRIVGRDATIRARANQFWQRRSVRRTLETLPVLAGYRTSVVLID